MSSRSAASQRAPLTEQPASTEQSQPERERALFAPKQTLSIDLPAGLPLAPKRLCGDETAAAFVMAALRLAGPQRAGALQAAKALGMQLDDAPYLLMLATPPDSIDLSLRLRALGAAGVDLAHAQGPHGVPVFAMACLTGSKPAVRAFLDAGADPFEAFFPERLPRPNGKFGFNDPKRLSSPTTARGLTAEEQETDRWLHTHGNGEPLDAFACAAMAGFTPFFDQLKERGLLEKAPQASLDRAALFAAGALWTRALAPQGLAAILGLLLDAGADFSKAGFTLPIFDREPLRARVDMERQVASSAAARILSAAARSSGPASGLELIQPLLKRLPLGREEADSEGRCAAERFFDCAGLRDFQRTSVAAALFDPLRDFGVFAPGLPQSEPALEAAFLCCLRNPRPDLSMLNVPLDRLASDWAASGRVLGSRASAFVAQAIFDFGDLAKRGVAEDSGRLHASRPMLSSDSSKTDSTQELSLEGGKDMRQALRWAHAALRSLLPVLPPSVSALAMNALREPTDFVGKMSAHISAQQDAAFEAFALQLSLDADLLRVKAEAAAAGLPAPDSQPLATRRL